MVCMKNLSFLLDRNLVIFLVGIKEGGKEFYLDAFTTIKADDEQKLLNLLGALILRAKFQQGVFFGIIKEIEKEEEKERSYWEEQISKIQNLNEISKLKETALATF